MARPLLNTYQEIKATRQNNVTYLPISK